MRLSDKMAQTRHNLDEIYDNLGEGITSACNEMFEHGAEAERLRIIKLLQNEIDFMWSGVGLIKHDPITISHLESYIALIKGENNG